MKKQESINTEHFRPRNIALESGIQHINNLNHRYGLPKFAHEAFIEVARLFNQFPVQLPSVKRLIRENDDSGAQLLHFAQLLSAPSTIWLLSRRADCMFHQDQLGRTPLHEAIRFNNQWLVETLLAHKASPIIKDRQGLCSLGEAAFLGHYTLLKRLLREAEQLPKSNNGLPSHFSDNLPLAVATRNGHLDCIKLLLKQRAGQINGYTTKGNTPLIIATMAGHYECTKWLLENGADPDLANFHGESAREIAQRPMVDTRITDLLYQY